MNGIFKRLAKWLVQHGLEELRKEMDGQPGITPPRQAPGTAPGEFNYRKPGVGGLPPSQPPPG